MDENTFGYSVKLPEPIREVYMWLCQHLVRLKQK